MENIEKRKKDWYEINKPSGQAFGYPECCIKAFGDDPPELMKLRTVTEDDHRRLNAGHINGEFTGFIPCAIHAKQITMGKITLQSLIKNRDILLPPFPDAT